MVRRERCSYLRAAFISDVSLTLERHLILKRFSVCGKRSDVIVVVVCVRLSYFLLPFTVLTYRAPPLQRNPLLPASVVT